MLSVRPLQDQRSGGSGAAQNRLRQRLRLRVAIGARRSIPAFLPPPQPHRPSSDGAALPPWRAAPAYQLPPSAHGAATDRRRQVQGQKDLAVPSPTAPVPATAQATQPRTGPRRRRAQPPARCLRLRATRPGPSRHQAEPDQSQELPGEPLCARPKAAAALSGLSAVEAQKGHSQAAAYVRTYRELPPRKRVFCPKGRQFESRQNRNCSGPQPP